MGPCWGRLLSEGTEEGWLGPHAHQVAAGCSLHTLASLGPSSSQLTPPSPSLYYLSRKPPRLTPSLLPVLSLTAARVRFGEGKSESLP